MESAESSHDPVGQESTLMTRHMRASGVDITISADRDDLYFQGQLAADDNFEPAVSVGLVCLEPDGVAFDVGACLGIVSMALSTLVPDGRVIAVEASQRAVAGLEATLAAGAVDNVTVVPAAAGSVVGSTSYLENPLGAAWGYTSAAGGYDVAQVTIDELVGVHRLDRVDLIKIDIEGNELVALLGAEQTIERFHPVLVVEVNPFCLWRFGRTFPQDLIEWVDQRYPHLWAIRSDGSVQTLQSQGDIDGVLGALGAQGGLVDIVAAPGMLDLPSPLWTPPVLQEQDDDQSAAPAARRGSWFRRR